MQIREYSKKDQTQVKELISGILGREFAVEDKAYRYCDLDSIDKSYGGKRDAFFVLDDAGKIEGTVAVKEESGKTAIIRRLFVDAAFRKSGYGGLLLDRAIDFCRDNGYREVIFHAANTMKSAMSLCGTRGFKEKEKVSVGDVNMIRFFMNL
jgi:GNAT superfamily N-acetyltransferase